MCRSFRLGLLAIAFVVGCGVGEPPTPELTATTFNAAGAPIIEFSVPDMMCPDGCGVAVKEILAEQPGARDVKVDFDSKTAVVAVDKDKFDADQALAALIDHQFNNSALKTGGKDGAAAAPTAETAPVR